MFLAIQDMQMGKVRFDRTFSPGSIDMLDTQLRQLTPLGAAGTAELMSSTMEIRVKGHIKVEIAAACDRCLEEAVFPIDTDFDLLYRPTYYGPEDEIQIQSKDTEVGFYKGEGLELADVLREEILLELPMQRVCSVACKGICPVCGKNRNIEECGCHSEPGDDRWAGLRDFHDAGGSGQ